MQRRDFLRLLGLGATATAAGLVLPELEPVRRYWAVPRNAPVPDRLSYRFEVDGWPGDLRSDNSGWMRVPVYTPDDSGRIVEFVAVPMPSETIGYSNRLTEGGVLTRESFQRAVDEWNRRRREEPALAPLRYVVPPELYKELQRLDDA